MISTTIRIAIERDVSMFAIEAPTPEVAATMARREIATQTHEDPKASIVALLNVSPSAMGWRLFNLGLVEEKPA